MKKFLLLFVTILFTSFCFGQWSVGPRAGVNFATFTGKYDNQDETNRKWIAAPVLGVVGNYGFTEMISLNAELLFITIGQKATYTETGWKSIQSEYEYSITERYHYLQMPILAKFTFGSNFSFFADAGPYFGYKIGGHYKLIDGDQTIEGRFRFKEDKMGENDWLYDPDTERRFDFGIYVGGGAGKKVGPGILEVDLRFGIGLLDHNKFESKEAKQNAKDNGYKAFRTMNISLTVAYMLPFGKDTPTRFLD